MPMCGTVVIRPFGQRVHVFPVKVLFCVVVITFVTSTFLLLGNPAFGNISRQAYARVDVLETLPNSSASNSFASNSENVNSYIKTIDGLQNRISILEEKLRQLEIKIAPEDKPKEIENPVVSPSECPIPSLEGYGYCEIKLKWMKEMWRSDKCYSDWGVNGSVCSMYKYLSEVEQWCPPLQTASIATEGVAKGVDQTGEAAVIRDNLNGLYELLGDTMRYKWIRMRVERMERQWLDAGSAFKAKYTTSWKKKKILLHMGLLSDESGWKIAENAFSGGPLGELVQWSDLMASLYVMGHDLSLTVSTQDLTRIFEPHIRGASDNCPLMETPFDLVYIDIRGMQMLRKVTSKKFHLIKCKLRCVDSFGTEPEYNDNTYATRKGLKSQWGKWDLHPKQFNTMFPHTPDNTFLGFVIEQQLDSNTQLEKENIALVYGKVDVFWKGKSQYIDAVHNATLDVHGTIDTSKGLANVPTYVINHGVLPGDELQALLRKTRVFVGMGFPYEGPAPLEAIANGAVFLNPSFSKTSVQARAAVDFYKGKPTSRRPTSQHPYASTYIGPPHVRTVELDDFKSVIETVKDIIASPQIAPYVPHEFTWLGMIERLAHQVQISDFCRKNAVDWPPRSSMQAIVSDQSETCADACTSRGLVCESAFFFELNKNEAFTKLGVACERFIVPKENDEDSAYPAHKESKCYLQSKSQLFSCAGKQPDARRLCPCRDYIKGQVALCKDCLLT